MCVISHKYKLIFIRCRKSASTSIQYALSCASGPYDIITKFDDKDIDNSKHEKNNWCYIPSTKAVFYNHIPAFRVKEMIAHMDKSIWDTYFKFCVERNPWDKAISEYYYSLRPGSQYLGMTAKEFIMHSTFPRHSSWRFYTDEETQSKVIVDKIFKYENLNEMTEYLIKNCGLPKDFKLPEYRYKAWTRINHSHYREVLDEDCKNRITKVHKKEIDYMGYEW